MERKKRKENCLSGEWKKVKAVEKSVQKNCPSYEGRKKYEGNCFRYLTFLAF